MSNPLLTFTDLPPFSAIKPEHVKPAVEQAIADCRHTIDKVLAENPQPSWESVIAPIEEVDDRLSRIWSPVSHMNSVVNSDELREAYESCLPLLSEYSTWVGQHKGLFEAYKTIKESAEFAKLDRAQQKTISDSLRDLNCQASACHCKSKSAMAKSVSVCLSLALSSPTTCWMPPWVGPSRSPM